jgi:predicted MFS family arabinose efflux permease
MSALARVVGPTVGGLLYTHISPRSPFQVSALVLVGGLGLAFYALRRLGPTPSA